MQIVKAIVLAAAVVATSFRSYRADVLAQDKREDKTWKGRRGHEKL